MYDDLMVIPELQNGTYILKAMQDNIILFQDILSKTSY